MGATIRFGTDGWRARIAEDYTFDNVRRCTQGFATYLIAQGKAGDDVVIGHDKRFAAEHFAAAAAEVMAANGFHVWLTDGSAPTPVISYSVVEREAAGGINITASHTPPLGPGVQGARRTRRGGRAGRPQGDRSGDPSHRRRQACGVR